MTHVAAIQMTTGADVARNLASAEALLREASARGASIAALPENFAYMGLNEADKLAISEAPGSGPIQEFIASLARELGLAKRDVRLKRGAAARHKQVEIDTPLVQVQAWLQRTLGTPPKAD